MILPNAPRRPSRAVAAALLLVLHAFLVDLFVHLRTPRARPDEQVATLLLDAARRPAPTAAHRDTTAARPPRPLIAPLPPVDIEPPHDSATPVGTPEAKPDAGSLTGAGAASAPAPPPLNLAIPREFYAHPPPLTPAQEAMADPRSNRLVLTRQEKLDVAFGVVECIAWQRMPDGSIYRGPGHRQRIQGIGTNPFTAHKPGAEDRPEECVR